MALGLTEGQSPKIPFFVGFHNSLISLDDTKTYWRLENTKDKSAYATVNVTKTNPSLINSFLYTGNVMQNSFHDK